MGGGGAEKKEGVFYRESFVKRITMLSIFNDGGVDNFFLQKQRGKKAFSKLFNKQDKLLPIERRP